MAHWCGDGGCEAQIKEETSATIRVISPMRGESGSCIRCGKPSLHRVHFAIAY